MRLQFLVLAAAVALMGCRAAEVPRERVQGGAPAVVTSAPAVVGGAAEKKLGDDQVQALIQKLGAEDFKTRSAAYKELVAAGPAVLQALEKAAHLSDAELAEQAKAAAQEIHNVLSAAANEALVKRHRWCYLMVKGAGWARGCDWPVIFGDTAYVADMDGKLQALDIQTGKPRWSVDAGGKTTGQQVAAGEKIVAVIQERKLTVYETQQGKPLWQKDFNPANAQAGAAGPGELPAGWNNPRAVPRDQAWVVGDMVVVWTGDVFRAYKGQSGEEMWHMNVKRGSGMCNAIVEEGIAYVTKDKSVAALDLASQKELWSKEMPGCLKLAKSGTTLVCVAGGKIVALDNRNGQTLWEGIPEDSPAAVEGNASSGALRAMAHYSGEYIAPRMSVDNRRVYVVTMKMLTTFDLKSGGESVIPLDLYGHDMEGGGTASDDLVFKAGIPAGGGADPAAMAVMLGFMINEVVAAEGTVYAVSKKAIIAFDGQSGARLWMLPLKHVLATEPVVAGDVLYFATTGYWDILNPNPMIGGPVPNPQGANAAAEPPLDQPGLHAVKLAR